jgi:uncharacterized membrane protein
MRTALIVHILAGGLGLLSGYLALYVAKGAAVHRRSGMLFVAAMLTMAVTGLLISAFEGVAPAINIPTALLTIYLVITSLTTVRPLTASSLAVDTACMLMGVGIAIGCFALASRAIAQGGAAAGLAYPLFLFGGVALAGSEGDRRTIRAGGLRGAARLTRHLWRMCVALFVASIAFYLGPDRVPDMMRSPVIRGGGLLLPILAMSYWLFRLRVRPRWPRGVGVTATHATAIAQVSR